MQPFKDGAFRIAVDTQKPMLPMVVLGAGKLMPPGTIRLRPGRIKIVVGKEIPFMEEESATVLKQRTFDLMLQMINDHSTKISL
jgi:1-acyl-sn-glycerol-3-phosphate acyltransferase